MDNKDLVTLQRFDNETDANIYKALLDDAGIPAMLLGEYAQGIFPYTYLTPIKLKVAAEDEQRAREILDAGFDECEFQKETTGEGCDEK